MHHFCSFKTFSPLISKIRNWLTKLIGNTIQNISIIKVLKLYLVYILILTLDIINFPSTEIINFLNHRSTPELFNYTIESRVT